jgi:uncharacterized protein involved in exopolysaccharide biosynthesis
MSAIRPEPKSATLRPREDDRAIAPPPQDEQQPLSVVALFNVLLRRRRIALGVPLLALILMLAAWLLGLGLDAWRGPPPPTYTATTTFDLEASTAVAGNNNSPLGGLASQLGLIAQQSGPPPYERLLRSRALIIPVTKMWFVVPTTAGPRRGTFADLYGIKASTQAQRQEKTINAIRAAMKTGTDKVGTPALMVTTPWPSLSVQLADSLAARLNEFNTERQQNKVGRERRFTEARLEEKRQELRTAEARMQSFLEANRDYRNSPMLTFQFDRINRELQLKQSLYNTLAAAVENARIDEVRNSPVVSVIEPAYVPPKLDDEERRFPELPMKGIVRFILAVFLGLFLAFAVEFYHRNREQNPQDAAELRTLARDAATDLRRPWRLLAGLVPARVRRRRELR